MNVHFLQEKPGVAKFILDLETPLGDKAYTLALRRSSDGYYLAQGGHDWTAQAQNLELPFQKIDTSIVFQFGPEYVNYMEPMNYQVTLYADGEPVERGRITIDSVQTQAIAGSGAMQIQPGREAQTAEVQPEVTAVAETDVAPEEPVPQQEESIAMPQPAVAPAKNNSLPLIIALVVVLLLGGGLGYYYYSQNSGKNVDATEDEKVAAEKLKAEEEAAARRAEAERAATEAAKKAEAERIATEAQKTAEATANATQRIDVRTRARNFFASQDKTPQSAYDLTKELETSTQEEQDAVFRLLYYAANGDCRAAYIPYARCLDPTTPPWGTISKDPVVAWEFYNKSESPEGTAAAQQVLEWVKQQATTSNKAKEWLKNMK